MLKQADYAQNGRMTVAQRPGSEDDWEISRNGSAVMFTTLRLEHLMELRNALNELYTAIFEPDGALKRLAPPVDVDAAIAP